MVSNHCQKSLKNYFPFSDSEAGVGEVELVTEREKRTTTTTSTEASTSPTAWSYKDAFANLLSANLRRRTPKPVILSSKETELESSAPRQAGTLNLGSVEVVDLDDLIGESSDQSEGDHEHGSDHHHEDGQDHGHNHADGQYHGHHHHEDHEDHHDHGHGHHTAEHFASLAANTESLPEAPPGNLGLRVTSSGLDEGTKNFVKVNNDMAFRWGNPENTI